MIDTPSIRERIFSSADYLYQEAGSLAFPTVDQVRRQAKANMNDASRFMREWRRVQSNHVTPITVQIPPALQQASDAALSALWSEATTAANETLRAAETGWESERADAEALREQLSTAYEEQARLLEASEDGRANQAFLLIELRQRLEQQQQELEHTRSASRAAANAAHLAEARHAGSERRAEDLRRELEHAHQTLAGAAHELKELRASHAAELSELRHELARAQQDHAQAQAATSTELSRAREHAAALQGQMDAFQFSPSSAIRRPQAKRQSEAAPGHPSHRK